MVPTHLDRRRQQYAYYARKQRGQGSSPLVIMAILLCFFAYFWLIASNMATGPLELQDASHDSYEPRAEADEVRYDRRDLSLFYGNEGLLRAPPSPPRLPRSVAENVLRGIPTVRVDVLLQRADGRVLLVQRAQEPVRGLYTFPGGDLQIGETFFEAAARHAEHGVNVLDAKPCAVLLTTNTFYEHAAWEGTQQTVNVLVHAAAPAAGDDLEICGDRPDFCHDGSYGRYRWIRPEAVDDGLEDTYVLEGLRALRPYGGTRCGDPPRAAAAVARPPGSRPRAGLPLERPSAATATT